MGRVQSAALHILYQRGGNLRLVPQDYWSVYVNYARIPNTTQGANSRIRNGSNTSDDAANPRKKVESVRVLSQAQADQIVSEARLNAHHVVQVDGTTTFRKPPAPFITSSLQQTAGSRLKYGSERTMKVAQTL